MDVLFVHDRSICSSKTRQRKEAQSTVNSVFAVGKCRSVGDLLKGNKEAAEKEGRKGAYIHKTLIMHNAIPSQSCQMENRIALLKRRFAS